MKFGLHSVFKFGLHLIFSGYTTTFSSVCKKVGVVVSSLVLCDVAYCHFCPCYWPWPSCSAVSAVLAVNLIVQCPFISARISLTVSSHSCSSLFPPYVASPCHFSLFLLLLLALNFRFWQMLMSALVFTPFKCIRSNQLLPCSVVQISREAQQKYKGPVK